MRRYADGAALIFTNAEALYDEAQLLGQAGHFARATVLHLPLDGQIFGQAVRPSNHRQVDEEIPERLAALFDETRRTIEEIMSQRSWPGLAIAVVDRDRVLWSETFGVSDGAISFGPLEKF